MSNVKKTTIQKEQKLSIIPKKGYSVSRPLVAIELKFRRPDGPSDNEFSRLIKNDIQKMSEIRSTIGKYFEPLLTCRMVAFDKKSELADIDNTHDEILVTYKFANKRHI